MDLRRLWRFVWSAGSGISIAVALFARPDVGLETRLLFLVIAISCALNALLADDVFPDE